VRLAPVVLDVGDRHGVAAPAAPRPRVRTEAVRRCPEVALRRREVGRAGGMSPRRRTGTRRRGTRSRRADRQQERPAVLGVGRLDAPVEREVGEQPAGSRRARSARIASGRRRKAGSSPGSGSVGSKVAPSTSFHDKHVRSRRGSHATVSGRKGCARRERPASPDEPDDHARRLHHRPCPKRIRVGPSTGSSEG
jgi:hypothetical protein